MAHDTALIIDRGDLPSLAVLAMQPDPARAVLWHPGEAGAAAHRRARAVQDHADALSAARVVMTPHEASDLAEGPAPGGIEQSRMLLYAVAMAVQVECPKVIWPVQVGPDHRLVGDAVNRANLVASLAELPGSAMESWDEPAVSCMIDLPVVDLTDPQLVEVLDDCGGPMGGFWPCRRGGEGPCGQCEECRRWIAAFEAAGVVWPWAAART